MCWLIANSLLIIWGAIGVCTAVGKFWSLQLTYADIISKETGLLGEAKRRKKLDPNFGLNNYEITFFTKDESNERVKEKWSNTTKVHPPFTSFKFSYGSETIFGLAFAQARNGVIALDYEWIFNPETITRQERILNRFIESINQEMLKKLLLEIDIDLNTKELPEVFTKSTEAKFNGL